MRKKRRKAVYVPYDYEAAYKNSLDKMEEANEERILKEGKVKSIYATKEIRSGDQLEVEIYPEFTKGQKDQIPDEGKRKRQRQAQKNLNDKNSKKMCERVIGENFTDRDIWATFTYTDDNMPASMEVATKNMGDLKEAVTLFDREKMTIELSTEAGDLWAKDLTGIKVRDRFDVQSVDEAAVVKGEISVAVAG